MQILCNFLDKLSGQTLSILFSSAQLSSILYIRGSQPFLLAEHTVYYIIFVFLLLH